MPFATRPAAAASQSYYVDCTGGSDSNRGLGPNQAWKTLSKANGASLAPGDKLLLKRGCTFAGTLRASWNGTHSAKILIGAYGSGAPPVIRNTAADLSDGAYNAVDITGSYLIIEHLEAALVNPPVRASCADQPVGWFIGFNFRNPNNTANGGSFNVLRYSKASGFTAGAHFNNNTRDVRVVFNQFVNNNVMHVLTPTSVNANDDIGAWGVLLKGRNHEVARNYFANNRAWCAFDTAPQGNAIELYEAQNISIHHNTSVDDRVFSELGGSAAMRVDGVTYAYNLVVSSISDARFIVARGADSPYGPTARVKLFNNTVHFTGAQSQAVVCGAGCNSSILTMRNNILWAEEKAIYVDQNFTHARNLYWSSNGQPFIQIPNSTLDANSIIANPRFIDPANKNFNLRSNSPSINMGAEVGWGKDLVDTPVPQLGAPDIGAYEFTGTESFSASPLELEVWSALVLGADEE